MHPPEGVDTFQATILPSNISKIPVSHRKTQNMIQIAAALLSKPGPASRHHHAGHTAVSRIGLDIPENQCAQHPTAEATRSSQVAEPVASQEMTTSLIPVHWAPTLLPTSRCFTLPPFAAWCLIWVKMTASTLSPKHWIPSTTITSNTSDPSPQYTCVGGLPCLQCLHWWT